MSFLQLCRELIVRAPDLPLPTSSVAGGVAIYPKSFILQGFISQKSRSVTAFRHTEVVQPWASHLVCV